MASFDDFAKLDIRVGKVTAVEEHEQARKPMYKMTVDFGPELGMRTIVAGIRNIYSKEELLGKKVVCVANLDPKVIAGVESQGMVLAAEDSIGTLALLTIDKDLQEGSKVR